MIESLLHINWEEFHFLRPKFLWLLVPLSVLFVFGLVLVQDQIKWKKNIAPHLRPFVIKKGSEAVKRWWQCIAFIVLSIAILGLSGPSWEKYEQPERTLETPMVILLDLSQSMMAADLQPNRLERAKFKITDFLKANPRVRVALIGYSGTAHTLVPLTNDYRIIEANLKGISTAILPYPGSDLEAGLRLSDSVFSTSEAPGTLLLLSDDFNEETFSLLQNYVNNGEVQVEILPMGTPSGAQVPAFGSSKPLRNAKGAPVLSAIDNEILQRLKSVDGIQLNALTLDNSDVSQLATRVSASLEFKDKEEESEELWKDSGLLFMVPFAFFVLLWFRKGWAIYSIVLLSSMSSCSSDKSFKDIWKTDNYRGQEHFDKGEYLEAASLFTEPMLQGVAYYKAENFGAAIEAFQKDSTAQGFYNLGLAYYKTGNLSSARVAFNKANTLDSSFVNAGINLVKTTEFIRSQQSNLLQAEEFNEGKTAENIKNTDPEDLGGGGQEATEEDMKKERKEETVATDIRMGKELDEVPEDFKGGKQDNSQKVLMRKVNDDPAMFLKKKFLYQVKKQGIKPKEHLDKW